MFLFPINAIILCENKRIGNDQGTAVSGVDTYWSVNLDAGLVLPKSAYIVQPDNNGPLYKIGKNGATYKRDNYTDEEIKMIESLLSLEEKEEYDKYVNGDFNEFEIKYMCDRDKHVKRMYESSKDKKAFLRGLFEEARFDMLSYYLRKVVTRMAMDKMGYQYMSTVCEGSLASYAIVDVAESQDILAMASKTGHDGSVYGKMDHIDVDIRVILYGDRETDSPGIFEMPDFASLYDVLNSRIYNSGDYASIMDAVITSIVENKPIDFMPFFQEKFESKRANVLQQTQYTCKKTKEDLDRHVNGQSNLSEYQCEAAIKKDQDELIKLNKYLKYWENKTTIAKFDKNLGKTIRRYCEKLNAEFEAWRNALSKRYGYDKFIESLRSNFYGDNKAKNWCAQSGKEM